MPTPATCKASRSFKRKLLLATLRLTTIWPSYNSWLSHAARWSLPCLVTFPRCYLRCLTRCVWFGNFPNFIPHLSAWRVFWPKLATKSFVVVTSKSTRKTCSVATLISALLIWMSALTVASSGRRFALVPRKWSKNTLVVRATPSVKMRFSRKTRLLSKDARIWRKSVRDNFNLLRLALTRLFLSLVVPRVLSGP